MAGYTTHLITTRTIAEDTLECTFERPNGFSFEAGQHIELSFLEPSHNDSKGNTRLFSLVSAPHETSLKVATRLTGSSFKESLREAEKGEPFTISEAMGNVTLHQDITRPVVFCAGGIGIAPVVSMVEHSLEEMSGHTIFLFYSNRTMERAAYLSDLDDALNKLPKASFIPTFTEENVDGCESGFITEEMLARYINDPQLPVYYIFGPPKFVAAMKKLVANMEVSDLQIKAEEFSGY